MGNLSANVVAMAIICGLNIKKAKNHYEVARWRQTAALWLPLAKQELANLKMIKHGLSPYQSKFYGHNPLTGLPCTIVFNEPSPGRSTVMNWNTLTQCWFYSEDAGLTWKKVQTTEDYIAHLEKVDCLMETPTYGC